MQAEDAYLQGVDDALMGREIDWGLVKNQPSAVGDAYLDGRDSGFEQKHLYSDSLSVLGIREGSL